MGSGSFGGGSGGFGGGGSGGGGSGGSGTGGGGLGGGGAKGTGSGSSGGGKGTDSVHERILELRKLTDQFDATPEIGKVSKTIYEMLQDRTRSAFLRATLSDSAVVHPYQGLLSIEAELRGGAALSVAALKAGISGTATLSDLADSICRSGQSATTDERVERIARRAVTDVLMRTVGNDRDLYYETPLAKLGERFDAGPLENTAGFFLGGLITAAVRSDLLKLSAEARAVVATASDQIARSWTDKFNDRRKKGVSFRDIMQTISQDFSLYLGIGK
jgi:hypothetical protein